MNAVNAPAPATNSAIHVASDEDFTVRLVWQADGRWPLGRAGAGEWNVRLYAEPLTNAAATETALLAAACVQLGDEFQERRAGETLLQIKAGALAAGRYKLLSFVAESRNGRPGPLVSFREGPVIHVG